MEQEEPGLQRKSDPKIMLEIIGSGSINCLLLVMFSVFLVLLVCMVTVVRFGLLFCRQTADEFGEDVWFQTLSQLRGNKVFLVTWASW